MEFFGLSSSNLNSIAETKSLFSKMGTTSKAEVMKPALLKVGIPLALSVAGFVCARIMARKSSTVVKDYSLQTQVSSPRTNVCDVFNDEDSFHSFPSTIEDEEPMINDASLANMVDDLEIGMKPKFEEILGFRSQVEDLERRAWELEKQFVSYCDLKEQESLLMELKNMVLLEIAHVEFLDREISSVEAENERLQNLVVQYVGVLEQLEHWKSKNGLLQRKVKRLLRRTKQQSRVIREQNMKIEDTEAEILRNCDELETRSNVIRKLEEEVRELHKIMDQMQEEKNELLNMLELAENSASSISKIEGEVIAMEAYNKLVNELEQLQKDRAAEVGELIFLRWINACLRHQLMRNHEQQQQQQNHDKKSDSDPCFEGGQEIGNYSLEHELDNSHLEHNEPCFGVVETVEESSEHACSKRGKLLQRLRRWVEGSDKARGKLDDKRRHEIKCFAGHSTSDGAEEQLHARRSCSST